MPRFFNRAAEAQPEKSRPALLPTLFLEAWSGALLQSKLAGSTLQEESLACVRVLSMRRGECEEGNRLAEAQTRARR